MVAFFRCQISFQWCKFDVQFKQMYKTMFEVGEKNHDSTNKNTPQKSNIDTKHCHFLREVPSPNISST